MIANRAFSPKLLLNPVIRRGKPKENLMSRSPFSRFSLCAAAIGALAVAAFAVAPSRAAEEP
jgi:hypothetical protein